MMACRLSRREMSSSIPSERVSSIIDSEIMGNHATYELPQSSLDIVASS